ncbi:hypothetical protein JVU11DRAFT_2204 [Chiua virens]|nr:hypothetical protein JVU11DRAFT_2204 [Chiua virens]
MRQTRHPPTLTKRRQEHREHLRKAVTKTLRKRSSVSEGKRTREKVTETLLLPSYIPPSPLCVASPPSVATIPIPTAPTNHASQSSVPLHWQAAVASSPHVATTFIPAAPTPDHTFESSVPSQAPVALLPNVATPFNHIPVASPPRAGVAISTCLATTANTVAAPAPLAVTMATSPCVSASQDPLQTYLPLPSILPSSPDKLFSGHTVPIFPSSFSDLLAQPIGNLGDISMDWNYWGYNQSPSLDLSACMPVFPSTLAGGIFDTQSAQNQAAPLTPFQPPTFNFGNQSSFINVDASVPQVIQVGGAPNMHMPLSEAVLTSVPDQPRMQTSGPLTPIQVLSAPPKSPTEPGVVTVVNIPQQTPGSNIEISSGRGILSRSKRKQVPYQRAQRDNAIGDLGKENHVPLPTSKGNSRGKKRAAHNGVTNAHPPFRKQKSKV